MRTEKHTYFSDSKSDGLMSLELMKYFLIISVWLVEVLNCIHTCMYDTLGFESVIFNS